MGMLRVTEQRDAKEPGLLGGFAGSLLLPSSLQLSIKTTLVGFLLFADKS